MKLALWAVGLVFMVLGVVWVLQGFNVLAGSAMSGHRKWIAIGGGMAVVGIFLEIMASKLKKK